MNTQRVSPRGRDCQALNYLGYTTHMEQTGQVTEQTQTRWLSEPEQQAWRAFLNACNRLFPELDAHLQHVAGIPHAYYEILRGWVERMACETDRRGQIARLTDEGFAALDAAAHHHVEQVRRVVFDQLTPTQVEQLFAISSAISAGVVVVSSAPAAAVCQAEALARNCQASGPVDQLEDDGSSCPL